MTALIAFGVGMFIGMFIGIFAPTPILDLWNKVFPKKVA